MKRYYDSVNFLVNYINFEKNLIATSDKQIKNNLSLSDIDYLAKNSTEAFPSDEVFDELYEVFLGTRDQVGKYVWVDTEDTIVSPAPTPWPVSGKAFKKHKIYLGEVE